MSQNDTQKINYKFRYKCVNPQAPTIFILPGGPGGTSSNSEINIPNANIVFIDPRGTGINKDYWLQPNSHNFSSEDIASDVVQVINALNPRKYYLYGHSYGTVIATIAGSKLSHQNNNINTPAGVILEGTKSTTFNVPDRGMAVANTILNQYRRDPTICYECAIKRLHSFLTPSEVGALLYAITYYGYKPHLFKKILMETDVHQLKLMAKKSQELLPEEGMRFYKQIACHELTDDGLTQEIYKDNRLISQSLNICSEIDVDNPYKSEQWQIKVPIFYLQGSHDSSTPSLESQQHYDDQTTTHSKRYICFPNAGHAPMDEMPRNCQDSIWRGILGNSISKEQLDVCKGRALVYSDPKYCQVHKNSSELYPSNGDFFEAIQ